jgi:site-specific DNA-methyltransferase (adenine-specific)
LKIHPCQKPVKLYKRILADYAKPGWKILDTHLGSGSIAIACIDMGFDLTGCEIDRDYYRAAMSRIKGHQDQRELFAPSEMTSREKTLFSGGGAGTGAGSPGEGE